MAAAGGLGLGSRPPPSASPGVGVTNTSAKSGGKRPTFHQMTADYITNMLTGATSDISPENKGSTVLVTDAYTLKILTYALSMSDIYQAGFMVVDKFETKKEAEKNLTRRPYYPLDVLYYIRANEWNLNRILGDYELPHVPLGQDCFERCFPWLFPKEEEESMPKPLYGECRLLTVTGNQKPDTQPNWQVARRYLQAAAENDAKYSSFTKYFRDDSAIKDCIVEYYALDTNVFSLGLPNTLSTLYPHKMASAPESSDWTAVNNTLDGIAFRIASALIVMNEKPYIRFSEKSKHPEAEGSRRGYTANLAAFLEDHLLKYQKTHASWTPTGHGKQSAKNDEQPATIFLVDRVDDIASALLHDFSYESAIIDLLEHEPGSVFHMQTEEGGKATTMRGNLDDSDPLFASMRYKNVNDVNDMLRELARNLKSQQSMLARDDTKALRKMMQLLLEKATKGDIQEKVNLHTEISLGIQNKITDTLASVYNLEQILVTGVNADGKAYSPKEVYKELTDTLHSNKVSSEMKLRLIVLYLLNARSIDHKTRKAVTEEVSLEKEHKDVLYNLPDIDIPLARESWKHVAWSAPAFDIDKAKRVAKNQTTKEKQCGFSRYTPKIVDILTKHFDGTLSDEIYPYNSPPPEAHKSFQNKGNQKSTGAITRRESKPPSGFNDAGRNVGESMRSAKPSRFLQSQHAAAEAAGNGNAKNDDPLLEQERHVEGPRTIVFVLGGITPLEVSALERLSRETHREIIYGSSSILSPSDFIDQVGMTRSDEEDFPKVDTSAP